jgi:hypothetical protein
MFPSEPQGYSEVSSSAHKIMGKKCVGKIILLVGLKVT